MRKKKIIEERDEARKLAEELMPLLINAVNFGLQLGDSKPEDHDEDDCLDCQVYRESLVWKERLDSGEIDRVLGKEKNNG